ncbi:MAG: YabP/YqfC family sporulation protein [Firmicutes bacterium]|nr:YabP/YqfC family sporulation protein [Bacillota bacterium]
MRIIEEMAYDLDFTKTKVIVTERVAILENITAIVMISEKALTVQSGKKYTTVVGEDFVIKEISEGRLIIEGKIQRVEFL